MRSFRCTGRESKIHCFMHLRKNNSGFMGFTVPSARVSEMVPMRSVSRRLKNIIDCCRKMKAGEIVSSKEMKNLLQPHGVRAMIKPKASAEHIIVTNADGSKRFLI